MAKILREYIYADDRRLDAYIGQIGGSVKYDKVPTWSVELSMTGPKAGGSQQRLAREMGRHEKVLALEEWLESNNHLDHTRPGSQGRPSQQPNSFVLETFNAWKTVIPVHPQVADSSNSIVVWISFGSPQIDDARGLLVLLEDYRLDDRSPRDGAMSSAYSVFASMLGSFYKSLPKLVLSDHLASERQVGVWQNPNHSSKEKTKSEEELQQYIRAHRRGRKHFQNFVTNPLLTLEEMGCDCQDERAVRALYRIRDFGPESGVSRKATSCFGYPIAMWLES